MSTRRRSLGPSILVGLLAFVITVELVEQRSASKVLAARRAELARVVEARQRSTGQLEARLTELRGRMDALAQRSGGAELRALRDLAGSLERLAAAPLAGPGLVVTLSDGADAADGGSPPDDFRIQDVDVQAVVNELWEAGAEAIAVNDQRLVATTAIRNAGAAVLVNYRVLTSPYRVRAIGPPDAMKSAFERSAIAARFRNWREIYGLGFDVESAAELALPAFDGSVRFRYARPLRSKS